MRKTIGQIVAEYSTQEDEYYLVNHANETIILQPFAEDVMGLLLDFEKYDNMHFEFFLAGNIALHKIYKHQSRKDKECELRNTYDNYKII